MAAEAGAQLPGAHHERSQIVSGSATLVALSEVWWDGPGGVVPGEGGRGEDMPFLPPQQPMEKWKVVVATF